jgi:DNA-binding FadR family transcriptional regulator
MIDAALFAITQDQRTMGERPRATRLTAGSAGAGSARVLSQQVVDRILELVRNGNLKPGDRLPPERELIDIFSISRPSLREALRSLSTLGVVEAQHGGGAYISDLNAKTMLAPLDFYLSLSKSSIKDTFESRRLIEVDLARRSAALATREDVSEKLACYTKSLTHYTKGTPSPPLLKRAGSDCL